MTDVERPGAERWVPEDISLRSLRDAAPSCRGCELWKPATSVVFSVGDVGASIAIVGEQPGDKEDLAGTPFVGPAGQLLARAVDTAGLDRSEVYLTNAVKHFRFEQRGKRRLHKTPETAHVVACQPWLRAEFETVAPAVIVALGATAARSVLGRPVKVGAERGRVIETDDAKVVVTTHPSALLRLRERADFDPAFDRLVDDLVTAASARPE